MRHKFVYKKIREMFADLALVYFFTMCPLESV